MAVINNAFTGYDAAGNRESLHDMISLITPDETPLFSMIGEMSGKATKEEWQTDTLAVPSITNARVDADTYEYDARTATSRVGNYHQIMWKTAQIGETQEVVDKAGRKSEVAYQKAQMGLELRTDIEATMLSNNASVAGAAATARQMGGLRAWLASNDSLGSGGASGGYNSSTGVVDAATNGTQRAFTKTLLDDTIQSTYDSGGNPKVLMVSPYVKRVFSTFMSDSNVAAFRHPIQRGQGTIIGAADAYQSDFGILDVVPNRQMSRVGASIARNAFLVDGTKVHKCFLRRIKQDRDAAKTGDAQPIVLKAEVTLKVDNEAAHGVVGDLFGMTATT